MIKSMSLKFNTIVPKLITNQEEALANSIISALQLNGRARLMSNSSFDLYDYLFGENYSSDLDNIIKESVSIFLYERFNILIDDITISIDKKNKTKEITISYINNNNTIALKILKDFKPRETNQNKLSFL